MKEKRIIFLPVPESLLEKLQIGAQDIFTVRSDIPIPVEIEDNKNISPENLSIETILCGMLRAIEEGKAKKEWTEYYCNFVLFLRPDIMELLNEIKANTFINKTFSQAHKLIRDGKAEEGLIIIREFLERHPRMYNGWFLLGWALRQLGRWADGEAALRKSIELGGDNSDTRNELAICMMETGNITGAKRELETALENDPENTKIISNLGVLALKTGNREEASGFFRTVLELDENDPVAKEFLKNN